MTEPLVMKQHDTDPALVLTLTDGPDGAPVNLTGATCRLIGRRDAVVLINASVTGSSVGVITYQWQAADTAATGQLELEVEVTRAGRVQTYPREGFVTVRVVPDIA